MLLHKKRIRQFIVLMAFFVLPPALHSQNSRNFPSLTGKKDVPVSCMAQTADGELWVGTAAGLVEYNGQAAKLYTVADGLSENTVTALFAAADHTLWIGHKNGKVTLMKKKKLSPFGYNEKLGDEPITAFSEASGIWIGSYGGGISYYADGKFKQYTSDNGLSDNTVYTLCSDTKENVWAGTDAGIVQINVKSGQVALSTASMKEGLPDNIVRSLVLYAPGKLYVAMQDSGICSYDAAAKYFTRLRGEWKYGTVTSLCMDKEAMLLAATDHHGLLDVSLESGKIQVIDAGPALLSDKLNSVFCDLQNNYWIATDKGLSELSEGRISSLTVKNGLPSDKVTAFCIDRKNNYWIGTDAGLARYSRLPDGSISTDVFFPSGGMPEKLITCVFEDSSGKIWAGTYGNGLYCLEPKSGKWVNISEKTGLAGDVVSGITEDKSGAIWISTLGAGISRIIGNGKNAVRNYSEAEGLHADYIYSVFCDASGDLWIASDGEGLIRFRKGVFTEVSKAAGIEVKTVYAVREDAAHHIWFSSAGQGLYRYDGRTFTHYSTEKGLRDNDPAVLETAGKYVIAVDPKGIDLLDPEQGRFSYFSVSDNDIEPNMNSSFADKDGNIWFGTSDGAVRFRTGKSYGDSVPPVVRLTGLTVQYQSYSPDSVSHFSYQQNNFAFNFAAVWLRPDGKIRFRYKLEGIDSTFIETTLGAAYYSSLPPGKYTFLVSAGNDENTWSVPVRYSFSIAAPFWHMWWFWLPVLLLGVLLLYFFVNYRLRALQKEKLILEHKVSVRTAEIRKQSELIEMKNRELERLSIVARETGNVILIMDAQGRVEWINDSFQRLNKVTLEELKKKRGETIFEVSNNPEIRSIVEKCIRERRSVVYESRNKLSNGEFVWESSTLTPIYNEMGELQKLIIIDTDVTDRKRSEEIIRQKNKDITDSIEYARRIQNSILPAMENIKRVLPESFIFYLQKDIVSGDFYWFSEKEDHVIIAAVDCTGHGVPGAFMSLIGYNLLNQIVNEKNFLRPGEILDELNRLVLKVLYRNNPENMFNDGMDISICTICRRTKEIQFAGAMRPMYLFGKDGFREIRGDKISIGTKEEKETLFTTHSLIAGEDDVFYISSDGYADQFGGKNGKKLMTRNFKKILSEIHELPFDEQHRLIRKYHIDWKGDHEQVDDILVMGFSVQG
jgi:PAS domain S-box-containing protein